MRTSFALLCIACAAPGANAGAPEIWAGYDYEFSKVAFGDPTDPANWDQITPDVAFTRSTAAGIFNPIIDAICSPDDPWMTAVDFASFVDAQQRAAAAYRDRERWLRMSILNSVASGRFSADRTMHDYNSEIWHLQPVAPLPLNP